LIESFGYTADQSLLYGTPGGAVEVVTLIASGYLGDRFGNRILVASGGLVLSIIGISLIVGLNEQHKNGRLAGYYLTQSSPTAFVCLLSLISSNIAGYTKKTTISAMFLIGYCTGNNIGKYFSLLAYLPAKLGRIRD
jgi:ACS family allantoate permease-like MFS transporter